MSNRKPFKITVINLSDKCKDDPEMLDRLTGRKVEIDCLAAEATKLVREAQVAAAKAQIAISQQTMAVQGFLVLAGEVDSQIAREPSAMPPYTNGKGELCVDIPFTQREQRMAVRAAHKQLAASQDDDLDSEMFDNGEEDQH